MAVLYIIQLFAGLLLAGAYPLPLGDRAVSFWNEGAQTICHTQVWDIAADTEDEDRIFCASNNGLCVFNGLTWDYLTPPGNPIIRALNYDRGTGRLYSSGVNGFGYWLPDGYGSFKYTPLYINSEFRSFSLDFWRIALYGHKVVFQSQKKIFIYDKRTESADTLSAKESFRFAYDVNGRVWCQDGSTIIRFGPDFSRDSICTVAGRVINLLPHSRGIVMAVEREGLILLKEDARTEVLNAATNKLLSEGKITCCKRSSLGKYLVGTTQSGLFIINENGDIEQSVPLGHNAILCLTADEEGNIWTGLNNGLAKIDNSSSDRYVFDDRLGQVHCVAEFDRDNIIIGSNKGVFAYNNPGKSLIAEQLPGPVWGFHKSGNSIYVLHDQGLFRINSLKSSSGIYTSKGVYSLVEVPEHQGLYIAGTYSGLSVFSADKNGDLHFRNDIEGYQGFSRNISVDEMSQVWVTVAGDGFLCLKLSDDLQSVADKKVFRLEGANNQVFSTRVDGQLVLVCGTRAYLPGKEEMELTREQQLDSLIILCGDKVRYLIQDGNRFWYVGGAGAGFIERVGSSLAVTTGILEKSYASLSGGNFSLLNGYAILGFRNGIGICSGAPRKRGRLHIVSAVAINSEGILRHKLSDPDFEIPANMNTVQITLAGLSADRRLEYKISSVSDEWTGINLGDNLQINSLQSGHHVIEMRTPDDNQVCSLTVHVKRPWYLSVPAILSYFFLICGIVFVGVGIAQRKNKRKQEELQKELEYLQVKNTLLDKERKLATHALLGVPADEDLERYFNEIYNGFTDRLKRRYPSLSKTDLKFCIFIKMNLSTKEIAERMNISPKGVEIGKYRLRKKLQLSPDTTLPDFIASLEKES